MERKYKIVYLPLFYEDLDAITDYISKKLENNIAANNLLNLIEKEIYKREYSPESYKKYESKKKRKSIYYKIRVKNYIILYTVADDTMTIRRILYGRRNFNDLV